MEKGVDEEPVKGFRNSQRREAQRHRSAALSAPLCERIEINGKIKASPWRKPGRDWKNPTKKQKSRMREISQVSDRIWEISFGVRQMRSQFGHNLKTKRK
mgnify:CR=1 FL=1